MNSIKFFDNFEGVWKDAIGSGGDIIAFVDGSGWTSTPKKGFINSDDIQGFIGASQIGSGNISNTEFEYLDGVSSSIQTQLNAKVSSPTWIDYSSSVTITGFSSLSATYIQYVVIGKMMYVQFDFTGTSNATTFTFSLPYSSSTWSGKQMAIHHAVNNTTTQAYCTSVVNASSSTCNLYLNNNVTTNAWTNTGTKQAQGILIIAIN